jgi:hypothetical protein
VSARPKVAARQTVCGGNPCTTKSRRTPRARLRFCVNTR